MGTSRRQFISGTLGALALLPLGSACKKEGDRGATGRPRSGVCCAHRIDRTRARSTR